MMKYKLQFFADEGANAGDYAEPLSEDANDNVIDEDSAYDGVDYSEYFSNEEDDDVNDGEDEPHVQTPEENAKFAAARREAEAKEKAALEREAEIQSRIDAIDAIFAQKFGGWKNPVTGEPIRSAEDYVATYDAIQDLKDRQNFEQQGISPEQLDAYIQRNPAVMRANEILMRQEAANRLREIDGEIAKIHELDPSISTAEDLKNVENFADIDGYFQKGYSIFDSFRLANFDKLQKKSVNAVKQATINQIKSTSHLESMNGLSAEGNDNLAEIPRDELKAWREYYPDLSMKDLKKKYNAMVKN